MDRTRRHEAAQDDLPAGPSAAGDPFGTAALRAAVLDAWAASPHRFREDANAEEWLSLGYAGRVIAELAANGADAAVVAGVPGRVAIRLDGDSLCVANTGAPLTAAGVAALASLRASAKRPEPGSDAASVGHFGVGFTAVRAVSDEITVVSETGSVRFSVRETAAAIEAIDDAVLRAEVSRRTGQLPALRLPWPVPDLTPPDGYVTEVRLRLRDDVDIDALASTLTVELAADLLWALPGLTAVALPGCDLERREDPAEPGVVTLVRVDEDPATQHRQERRSRERQSQEQRSRVQRFRVHSTAGELPAALLADRPVEERGRTGWFVTWIVPLGADDLPVPARQTEVGAPTSTAEKLGLPARLVASLPVDEVRSRIADGPLTDYVAARAAEAYCGLLRDLPDSQRWALLPAPGFPLGEFDGRLRDRLATELSRADILPGAGGRLVVPAEAVMIPGIADAAASAVAEAMPDLVPWPPAVAQVEALRALGVRVGTLDDALGAVAMLDRPPAFYRPLYEALAEAPADDLAGLPVPRAGGGTLVGARGVLLDAGPEKRAWAERAARLVPGIRLAARGLDHPLLRRLGARELTAETLMAAPELEREIERRYDDFEADWDDESADDFAELVLGLVREGGSPAPGGRPDLRHLLLTDARGGRCPAGELLLPGAPLRAVLADDVELPTVGTFWTERFGVAVLETAGVRTTFGIARHALPPGADADLDDVDAWWEDAAAAKAGTGSGEVQEFTAITDLDLVADDAWSQALALIADSASTRDALRRTAFGPSYSAWWLRRYAVLGGRPPSHWRTDGAAELAGLYDALPAALAGGLPDDLLAEIGVLTGLADAVAEPGELLARWADESRELPAVRVAAVTRAVIDALDRAADEIPLPAMVRALNGAVVDAEHAAVLDHPMLAQVLDAGALVAGGRDPARTADLLDLPLASGEGSWIVIDSDATATTLGDLPAGRRCLDGADDARLANQPVTVAPDLAVRASGAVAGAAHQRVSWWIADDGVPHLDGSARGIARAVAFLAGRWTDRHTLQAIAGGAAADLAELGIETGGPSEY